MIKQLFSDKDGNWSAKRVAGFLGLFVASYITYIAVTMDSATLASVAWPMWTFPAACLGVTAFERKS